MSVTFQLPPDLEQRLRDDVRNVDVEAKEAFLVAMYRQGKLTHLALSQALGLDRLETEEVLRRHNVVEDLGTVDDYLRDARELERLRTSR